MTALVAALVPGAVERFPTGKHVVSSIGLAPSVDASASECRLGHVRKHGNALLRFVLGQAGPVAVRTDADLRRLSCWILHRHGRATARVAVARKLLLWCHLMLRDGIDSGEFRRRGQLRCLAQPDGETAVGG